MMDAKLQTYLSSIEEVTREIFWMGSPNKIAQYISSKLSQTLGDKIQYAFLHRASNQIYESAHMDSNLKHLLPFFMTEKFIDKIKELNWSIVDTRGVKFVFDEVMDQSFNIDKPFLIIPRKKGSNITNFSVVWGGSVLERIDKQEVDFVSSICNAAESRIL
ncbi:MAG: hypothetical protein ACOC7U_10465, partial [Spirochaetota bacterium]